MSLPRTQIFKPSDWLDMQDCAYEFGTLARLCDFSTNVHFPPYLLDIIDNIKNIERREDAPV